MTKESCLVDSKNPEGLQSSRNISSHSLLPELEGAVQWPRDGVPASQSGGCGFDSR